MNIEQEIEYHRNVVELREPVVPTPVEKFREYAEAPNYKRNALHYFLSLIHERKPVNILELGSGAGQLTTRLAKPGYHLTGLELSPELAVAARERAELDGVADRVIIEECDISTYDPAEKFDIVIAKLVLHHLDLEMAMKTILKSLNPNGVAVILEPVAFSKGLQFIRDLTPVEKDISPNERQLSKEELQYISSHFDKVTLKYFYMTSRIQRILPAIPFRDKIVGLIESFDRALLNLIPASHYFAGTVVMYCEGPKRAQIDTPNA